jgi:hypothetical protein
VGTYDRRYIFDSGGVPEGGAPKFKNLHYR